MLPALQTLNAHVVLILLDQCRSCVSAHPADTHSATTTDKVQALGADSTLLTAGQQRLKLEDTGQLAMQVQATPC